jgi:hypothetical protein
MCCAKRRPRWPVAAVASETSKSAETKSSEPMVRWPFA